MLISIFDTPKLSLTVMRSVMLITPIWLEVVDPGAKTFLDNDPETFTVKALPLVKGFFLSQIKS